MRILILGASGQIGKELAWKLGHALPEVEIIGTKRHLNPVFTLDEKPLAPTVRILAFDPFQDDWEKLGKFSVVINAIGIIRETPENSFVKIHGGLTQLLLQNRKKLGNPKIIQFSVLGADETSDSPFLQTKGLADSSLLKYPNTVVVRPSIVCTPNTVFVQKLRLLRRISKFLGNQLPFPVNLLPIKIQPVMMDDIAELVLKLCTAAHHANLINIAGPEAISLQQFLDMLPVQGLRIRKLPRRAFDKMAGILFRLCPNLLNSDQYKLLAHDNTTNISYCEYVLNRKMTDTLTFWRKELHRPY